MQRQLPARCDSRSRVSSERFLEKSLKVRAAHAVGHSARSGVDWSHVDGPRIGVESAVGKTIISGAIPARVMAFMKTSG